MDSCAHRDNIKLTVLTIQSGLANCPTLQSSGINITNCHTRWNRDASNFQAMACLI